MVFIVFIKTLELQEFFGILYVELDCGNILKKQCDSENQTEGMTD